LLNSYFVFQFDPECHVLTRSKQAVEVYLEDIAVLLPKNGITHYGIKQVKTGTIAYALLTLNLDVLAQGFDCSCWLVLLIPLA